MNTQLNSTELAKLLRVSRQSIYNWLKSDEEFRKTATKTEKNYQFDLDKVRVWYDSKIKRIEW